MIFRLWLSIILTLIISACADPHFMDNTKINGSILRGAPATESDSLFGRTVYIAKNVQMSETSSSDFQHFGLCSGVILLKQYVLTAAHCANNLQNSRVLFITDINQGVTQEQIYKIQNYKVVSDYSLYKSEEDKKNIRPSLSNKSNEFDLALLQLDREIDQAKIFETYLEEIPSAVSLANKETATDVDAIIAGYGRITEYNKIENDPFFATKDINTETTKITGRLLKANLSLQTASLEKQLIQVNQKNSSGVCSGDSGGPLFINRDGKIYLQAIAIATFKNKSDDSKNSFNSCYGESLFLNLDFHKKWIKDSLSELQHNK